MNKDQAIEACAKAMMKRQGYREESWRDNPTATDLAANLVASLEALGLFNPETKPQ